MSGKLQLSVMVIQNIKENDIMNIDRIIDYCYITGYTIAYLATATATLILVRDIYMFAKQTFSGINFSKNNRILALTFLGAWSGLLIVNSLIEIFSNRAAFIIYYGRNHPSIQQYNWTVYPPFIYPI